MREVEGPGRTADRGRRARREVAGMDGGVAEQERRKDEAREHHGPPLSRARRPAATGLSGDTGPRPRDNARFGRTMSMDMAPGAGLGGWYCQRGHDARPVAARPEHRPCRPARRWPSRRSSIPHLHRAGLPRPRRGRRRSSRRWTLPPASRAVRPHRRRCLASARDHPVDGRHARPPGHSGSTTLRTLIAAVAEDPGRSPNERAARSPSARPSVATRIRAMTGSAHDENRAVRQVDHLG